MLYSFANAAPVSAGRLRALPLSIAAHIAVILVVMAPRPRTSASAGELRRQAGSSERVRYIEVAPVPPSAPVSHPRMVQRTATTRPAVVRPSSTVLPTIAPVKIDLPSIADVGPSLPDVDLSKKVSDSLDFGPVKKLDAGGAGLGRGSQGGDVNNGIYTADLVEKIVMPYPDNPKPVYPPSMLSAGIEASFVVRFVVDTTGRVDDHSLNFPSSAGRLFIDAVQRVLMRSKYRPAELGGRRVNQLVEQQFTFRIAR